MEANQILQSGFLEILFEGRNKSYGAYDLRKTYNKRISTGVFSIIVLVRFCRTQKFFKGSNSSSVDFHRQNFAKDPLVLDPPPDIRQIENARIDDHTVEGPKPIGMINPPVEVAGTNVALAPVTKGRTEDSTFIAVEIEASFPGGAEGWQRYIRKAILAQLEDFSDADFGTCMVRFIVDKTGAVSDVQATTMKGSKLAEIAVNAIRKGPKWKPAQQNGQYVNAYRLQPVTLQNPNQ